MSTAVRIYTNPEWMSIGIRVYEDLVQQIFYLLGGLPHPLCYGYIAISSYYCYVPKLILNPDNSRW